MSMFFWSFPPCLVYIYAIIILFDLVVREPWITVRLQIFLRNCLSCDRRCCNFQSALMLMPPCMPMKRCVCVFYHNWATSAKREKKTDFATYLNFIHSEMLCIQILWSHEYMMCYYFTTMNVYSVCIFAWFIRRKFFSWTILYSIHWIVLCAGDSCLGRVIQLSAYPGHVHSYCCHLGILWWWSLGVALNLIDFQKKRDRNC